MTPFDEAPKLAPFTLRGHNPDVLNTIANLSNDEVFTPPELANEMLDMLEKAWAESNDGANIWADHTVTFLDPFTKSGVFLREITARLVNGLEESMPDLQQRVNHILTKQVFGIGITQLTSLLARRSVYCSKSATGKHSIVKTFDRDWGNIWFERTEHTWVGGTEKVITMDERGNTVLKATNGRCKYCGAQQSQFERNESLESHAYAFIHTDDIKARMNELFGENMHFDVVIGNPPYQMAGAAGGSSDASIYHFFVEQAKALEPRFLSMVIPSRWMAGGRGMESFRADLLNSDDIREIVDYPSSRDVFPGVEVKGGICFFLSEKGSSGATKYTLVRGEEKATSLRRLNEFDVFVRSGVAVSILRKVLEKGEPSITSIMTRDTPFGIPTNFKNYSEIPLPGSVPLYLTQKGKRSIGFVKDASVTKNRHLIDTWKVLMPKAGSDGGQKIPDSVLGKPWIANSPSVCTQSFIFMHAESKLSATNMQRYYKTKFFRFLVSLRKITQDALFSTYQWVPVQEWSSSWDDSTLYEKYGLDGLEIDYIESVIRPMELNDE